MDTQQWYELETSVKGADDWCAVGGFHRTFDTLEAAAGQLKNREERGRRIQPELLRTHPGYEFRIVRKTITSEPVALDAVEA